MAIDAGYKITPLSGSGIQIQYSADGSTWHSTFTDGDVYMRQKVDGGDWTDPIKIVGEDGKNAVAMTSATTPSGEYEGQVGIWQNQIYFWTNGEWVNQTPELPTDAVLHYSFDEVPDYPDGTADYFKTSFDTTTDWSYNGNRTILSLENEGLKVQSTGTDSYVQIWGNHTKANVLSNKIIKMKFHANVPCTFITKDNGGSYSVHTVLQKNVKENYYIVEDSFGSFSYQQLFDFQFEEASSDNYVIIDELYIGDGSYSTPIIDNVNGENTPILAQKYIADQGISGKSASFFSNQKTIEIKWNASKWDAPYTVSCWCKSNGNAIFVVGWANNYNVQNHLIRYNNNNKTIWFDVNENTRFIGYICNVDLDDDKWHNLIFINKYERAKSEIWIDGIKQTLTTQSRSVVSSENTFVIGTSKASSGYNSVSGAQIDDYLIFDRALSEQEVLALYQNKANTPKYYDLSDYSLEQIDNDNVVDHLTEKPQLLSKWLEIYNAKNVSSALPTSNVSTNGEYKGVINTANEVGVISTEQLENYIQATNALRSALWGTNGYLVDMNTDSTLNGNLDTLFANYRETLQIARTQITQQQASIASALSVVNSNPFQLIPVNSQGEVITGGYDNTGTRLQVFNGTTVLTPKSSSATLSNGEWKVTANGSGVVAGSQAVGTGDNKYIDFGNVSNLTAETAVITYTINVMLNNTPNTIYVVQKFGKSKEGADGRIYTLLPDYTAVKKSADGSVLTPSSVTVQAKSWTGSNIPALYGEGDLKAFENNVQIGSTVSQGNSITVTPSGDYPVIINLYRHGTNTLIDTVTIPILQEVKGDQGEAGLTWFSGNAINGYDTNGSVYSGSGINNARIGDFYLNTDTQDIYECVLGGNASTALWKWNGNLTSDENTNLIRFNPFTPITSVANKVYSVIEEADAPWGGTTDVMKCFRTGEVTTQWNSINKNWSKTPIDTSKKYRFSVFFKQITTASNISNYFGAGIQNNANYVASLGSDTGNTNFYFTSFSTYREKERWYLLVAHIHPFDTTRTTADDDSGIYDALTGEKLSNVNDCKWMENAPSVYIRNMYVDKTTASSNPDSAVEQWFCSPRIDICNGLQPSVKDLLNGNFHTTEWYSGTAITGTSTTGTVFSGSGISWAVKGDKYLNTDTNNLYECTYSGSATVAKWAYQMNIKGDKGDNGTLSFVSDQTHSWTDSQWNDYSTAGRVTNWNNSTVEGMRVGDILQIPATLTEQGNITGVVYARITSIPTTKSGGLYQIPTVTLYGQKGNKGDKGDTGVGITAVTEYYLRNNSSTAPVFDESTLSNWSTTASNPTSTAQYLWNAERITKSDGTTTTYEYMTPHLAMKYTANGTNGKGIVNIKNYYLASSLDSGVTTETQGWTEAVQTVSSTNRYLWNYEEITYTTGNPTKTSPAIIGTFGAVSQGNWLASHSYKVSDIVYYQGSSYICKTAHTSGSTFDSSKWNKLADKGGDGIGVTSVIAYTALSTDTTKPASSDFTITAKSVDSTNRYLWRYEVTTYTDNSTTGSYADATIIGVWGNSGIDATSVSISSEQIEVMCGSGNGKFLGQQTQKITVYARKGSAKKACTLSFTSPASGTGITITKQNGTASADGYFNITFADNGNLGGDSTNSFDLSLTVTVDTVPFVFTVKAVKASKGVYLGRCASKPSTATVTVYTGDTWNGSSVTKYALKGDYVSVVNMTESDSNRGKMFQWNGLSWNEDGNTGHAMEALDDMLLMADKIPDGSDAIKFIRRLVVAEEFLHKLFVNKIKLMNENDNIGAIYGGKYDQDGNVDPEATTDKGVYLDADGEFKASNGQLEGTVSSMINNNIVNVNYGYLRYKIYYMDSETGMTANTIELSSMEEANTFVNGSIFAVNLYLYGSDNNRIATLELANGSPYDLFYKNSDSADYNNSETWIAFNRNTIPSTKKYVHLKYGFAQGGYQYYTIQVNNGIVQYNPRGWKLYKEGLLKSDYAEYEADVYMPSLNFNQTFDNDFPVKIDLSQDNVNQIRAKLDKIINSQSSKKYTRRSYSNSESRRCYITITSYDDNSDLNVLYENKIAHYLERVYENGYIYYRIGNIRPSYALLDSQYYTRTILQVDSSGIANYGTYSYSNISQKLSLIYIQNELDIHSYEFFSSGMLSSRFGYNFTSIYSLFNDLPSNINHSDFLYHICEMLDVKDGTLCMITDSSWNKKIAVIHKPVPVDDGTYIIRSEGTKYILNKDSTATVGIYQLYI